MLPDYKLIGPPRRFLNGRGVRSTSYMQKFRLLAEKRVRLVSLKTTDSGAARSRAVRYVEARLREDLIASDPAARTANKAIGSVVKEYTDNLQSLGNSPKQISAVKMKLNRIIKAAKLKEYSQVDSVVVTKAIAKLMTKHKFGVNTANHYREAARAWSRWVSLNARWPVNVLASMPKIKGDTSAKRKREILTDTEFEKLLRSTKSGPDRRRLSGDQRYWLYLVASQTGARAQELHSLKPSSFHLDAEPPYVEIHCTISKRRTTDQVMLRRDFAEMLRPWLGEQDPDRRLWGSSASWFNKAASMLRADLDEANIEHERGGAQIDFHSFRCFRVTRAILSGQSSRVVMQTVRLSSESLLARYSKISQQDVEALVESVALPNCR